MRFALSNRSGLSSCFLLCFPKPLMPIAAIISASMLTMFNGRRKCVRGCGQQSTRRTKRDRRQRRAMSGGADGLAQNVDSLFS